jgi:hypothetical protein
VNANDPSKHWTADGSLTIWDQLDADTIFTAEARAFQLQSNIQTAIITTLNQAVPKCFKCSKTVRFQNNKTTRIPTASLLPFMIHMDAQY